MKRIALFFVALCPLTASSTEVFYSAGLPTSSQNLTIHSHELGVKVAPSETWGGVGVFGYAAGQLLFVGDEVTVAPVIGGGVDYSFAGSWGVYAQLSARVLEQHEFSNGEGNTKDYGGPFQFGYSFGLMRDIGDRWALAYQYQHTSNWNNYDSNPALNSHNLVLSYRMD